MREKGDIFAVLSVSGVFQQHPETYVALKITLVQ